MARIPTIEPVAPSGQSVVRQPLIGDTVQAGNYSNQPGFKKLRDAGEELRSSLEKEAEDAAVSEYQAALSGEQRRISQEALSRSMKDAQGAQRWAEEEFTKRAEELEKEHLFTRNQRNRAYSRKLGMGADLSAHVGLHESRETKRYRLNVENINADDSVLQYGTALDDNERQASKKNLANSVRNMGKLLGWDAQQEEKAYNELLGKAAEGRISNLVYSEDFTGAKGELEESKGLMDPEKAGRLKDAIDRGLLSKETGELAAKVSLMKPEEQSLYVDAVLQDENVKPEFKTTFMGKLNAMEAQQKQVEERDKADAWAELLGTAEGSNGNYVDAMNRNPSLTERIGPVLTTKLRNMDEKEQLRKSIRRQAWSESAARGRALRRAQHTAEGFKGTDAIAIQEGLANLYSGSPTDDRIGLLQRINDLPNADTRKVFMDDYNKSVQSPLSESGKGARASQRSALDVLKRNQAQIRDLSDRIPANEISGGTKAQMERQRKEIDNNVAVLALPVVKAVEARMDEATKNSPKGQAMLDRVFLAEKRRLYQKHEKTGMPLWKIKATDAEDLLNNSIKFDEKNPDHQSMLNVLLIAARDSGAPVPTIEQIETALHARLYHSENNAPLALHLADNMGINPAAYNKAIEGVGKDRTPEEARYLEDAINRYKGISTERKAEATGAATLEALSEIGRSGSGKQ
jgi:hypothetical protein